MSEREAIEGLIIGDETQLDPGCYWVLDRTVFFDGMLAGAPFRLRMSDKRDELTFAVVQLFERLPRRALPFRIVAHFATELDMHQSLRIDVEPLWPLLKQAYGEAG